MQLSKLLDPEIFNKLCNAVQLDPLTVSKPRVHLVKRTDTKLTIRHGDDDRGFDVPKPYKSNMAGCCNSSEVWGRVPRMQTIRFSHK
jgi:hypothetical protein